MKTIKLLKEHQGSTLVEATYPSKEASTGVLQGDAASANVSPAKYAWTPDKSCKQDIEAIILLPEDTKARQQD